MVSSAAGFGVVRGDTGGSRGSVGPRPRGSGGDTRFRCPGEDRLSVGICTFSSAPTGGGFVDRMRWPPPTVDGRSRQISVWRSTSPATGASSRQELGRGRMCRSPVAAYQLRPTGVLSRCVRPRIAGNPCTDRWTPSRTSVCGGRCREARDLGAVARVRRTSVRGAGTPRRDASIKGETVVSRRSGGNIANAPGPVLLLSFSAFLRGLSQVEIDGRCWIERLWTRRLRGSPRGGCARSARSRSSHVAGANAGGNTRIAHRVKLTCSRGNCRQVVRGRLWTPAKGTRGRLR